MDKGLFLQALHGPADMDTEKVPEVKALRPQVVQFEPNQELSLGPGTAKIIIHDNVDKYQPPVLTIKRRKRESNAGSGTKPVKVGKNSGGNAEVRSKVPVEVEDSVVHRTSQHAPKTDDKAIPSGSSSDGEQVINQPPKEQVVPRKVKAQRSKRK